MNTDTKLRKTRRISAQAQRTEILDAASEMLAKLGPDGLSVRKLATSLGTSTMVIYTAFGGKEGLISALYDEAYERMAEMQQNVPRPNNPLEWLARLGAAYRHFALTYPAYYALMISSTLPLPEIQTGHPAADPATINEPVARGIARQRAYHSIEDCVSACQAAAYFDPALKPSDITAVLWATVHGHASLELAGFHATPEDAERAFLLLTSAILTGLLTRKGRTYWTKQQNN
ncbi:MAG: TetR/AcrR family transcriptional regulator [Parvibaculum sp.]